MLFSSSAACFLAIPGKRAALSGAKQGDAGLNLGNGNLMYTVSQDSVSKRHTLRWETYTSFNMPKEVKYASLGSTIMSTAADRTLSFTYGPEHQRVKQVVKLETNAPTSLMGGTTWYLHGSNNSLLYEKEVKANGVTEHRHYLQAAGMTVALAVVRSGTGVSATHANVRMRPTQLTYYQQDHLGSIALVTDANGAVLERMAYDPWGKRRFTTGLADKNDSIVGVNTDRGYTEHEHLDEMGVIHMNGRLYDPLVGRFMSADPYIQSPENLQSYNRFAYVMNNPLAYTHPSGYWSWRKFIRSAVMIAAAVYLGPAVSNYLLASWGATTASIGASAMMTVAAGAISGAVAGYAGGYLGVIATGGNSAEARAAGKSGAISGALFGAAGGVGAADSVARYVAHATAGCLSAVAGGGKCGQGAVSAAFDKWSTNATAGMDVGNSVGGTIARGAAAMVAGGVGSMLAGGKFANGAETAAYGFLFNEVQAIFKRETGQLTVRDKETGKQAEGKFFSGTSSKDQIPAGEYSILEGRTGYRLEPHDSIFGDDMHDQTGRTLLRLHGPGGSIGCVTACDASSWSQVSGLISSTSTSQAKLLNLLL
jgi:RHS repeat-associated protein